MLNSLIDGVEEYLLNLNSSKGLERYYNPGYAHVFVAVDCADQFKAATEYDGEGSIILNRGRRRVQSLDYENYVFPSVKDLKFVDISYTHAFEENKSFIFQPSLECLIAEKCPGIESSIQPMFDCALNGKLDYIFIGGSNLDRFRFNNIGTWDVSASVLDVTDCFKDNSSFLFFMKQFKSLDIIICKRMSLSRDSLRLCLERAKSIVLDRIDNIDNVLHFSTLDGIDLDRLIIRHSYISPETIARVYKCINQGRLSIRRIDLRTCFDSINHDFAYEKFRSLDVDYLCGGVDRQDIPEW